MKNKKHIHCTLYISLILILNLVSSCKTVVKENSNNTTNLVTLNTWYVAGPVLESQETINTIRKKEGVIRVTALILPLVKSN